MPVITDGAIASYARGAGFPPNTIAIVVAIALAESGGDTTIVSKPNTNGTRDNGLMQINDVHAAAFPVDFPLRLNPFNNMRMAFALYKGRGGAFTDWTTFNNGAYARFLPRGNTAAGTNVQVSNTPTVNSLNSPAASTLRSPTNTAETAFWAQFGVFLNQKVPVTWIAPSTVQGTVFRGPFLAAGVGHAFIDGSTLVVTETPPLNIVIYVAHVASDGTTISHVIINLQNGIAVAMDMGDVPDPPSVAGKLGDVASGIVKQVLDGLFGAIPIKFWWIGGGAILVLVGGYLLAKESDLIPKAIPIPI